MLGRKGSLLLGALFSLLVFGCFQNVREGKPVPEMTKEELKATAESVVSVKVSATKK